MNNYMEDKMVKQIEKSLTNNINDNVYLSGVTNDIGNKPSANSMNMYQEMLQSNNLNTEKSSLSSEYDSSPTLSREEYIRQAREACLNQFNHIQSSPRTYDTVILDTPSQGTDLFQAKKSKTFNLFHNGNTPVHDQMETESPQEIAAFRFLIIRIICAIVIFLTVFLIDKLNVNIGELTPDLLQKYVTGNDALQKLENIVVTWMK